MRRSDREAEFTEYVDARRAQLSRTAYLLCGDSHRAEDLVQTALVKLYLAWPRVRKDGNVDAFARRVRGPTVSASRSSSTRSSATTPWCP